MNLVNIGKDLSPFFKVNLKRVLVIEDEKFWQSVFQASLRKVRKDIDVVFAENADDAMARIARDQDIDFILSDYRLSGGKTGLDLWDHLLDLSENGQVRIPPIPFLLVSGITREDFIEKLKPYRVRMLPRYVEKPKSMKELVDMLSREVLIEHGQSKVGGDSGDTLSQRMKKKYYWMLSWMMGVFLFSGGFGGNNAF